MAPQKELDCYFKGDIGQWRAYIGLYCGAFWALSSYKPLEPRETGFL